MGFLSKIWGGIKKAVKTVANIGRKIALPLTGVIIPAAGIVSAISSFIPGSIGAAIGSTAAKVAAAAQKVAAAVSTSRVFASSRANSFENALLAPVQTLTLQAQQNIADFAGGLFNELRLGVGDVFETLKENILQIFEPIAQAFWDSIGFLVRVTNDVVASLAAVGGAAVKAVVNAASTVFASVKALVEQGVETFNAAAAKITGVITTAKDKAAEIIDNIRQTIADLVEQTFGTAKGALGTLAGLVEDLPKAWRDTVDEWVSKAETIIGEPLKTLPSELWDTFAEQFSRLTSNEQDEVRATIEQVMFSGQSPPATVEEARIYFGTAAPKSGLARFLTNTFFTVLTAVGQANAYATSRLNLMQQEGYREAPSQLLAPADALSAWRRHVIGDEQLQDELRAQGYGDSRQAWLQAVTEALPAETDAIDWWHRGIIDQVRLERILQARGWSDADIARIEQAAQILPPVQDLITMAVREVFTPETAERFGQFEDFPPQFEAEAAKLGLSKEWARNYWAAHWSLPSVQMGFEMLHRRVIDANDLNLLLRAADIMPFWRDKLTAISYAPLTRVDVRRMHALGVLTRAEVKDAYLDLGYNDENAERLTQFTEQLNAPKTGADDNEAVGLTRAAVVNMYRDGVFDRSTAEGLLESIGLSTETAALFLDAADLDEQREERAAEASLILEQAKAGTITFDEAQAKLGSIGLESAEQQKLLTRLVREQQRATKLPSRAALDRMVDAGLVSDAEYIDVMRRLGYARKWAEKFLQLAKG